MLSKTPNSNQKIIIRAVITMLMILLSKNVEIEIIRPDLTIKVSTESVYSKLYEKLIE